MSEFGVSFASSDLTSMLQERLSNVRNQPKVNSTEGAPQVGGGGGNGPSFMDALQSAVGNVNESLVSADKASRDFTTGKAENLHDVMIAMEKADVSLRTLTAVRGKVMEAYQEIMKMPI